MFRGVVEVEDSTVEEDPEEEEDVAVAEGAAVVDSATAAVPGARQTDDFDAVRPSLVVDAEGAVVHVRVVR